MPSMTSRLTWMPCGPSWRAIDSARLFCAALAAAPRRGRADEDDRALLRALHRRNDLLRDEQRAVRVGAPGRFEIGRRDLVDRTPEPGARVVDEHFGIALPLADRIERHRDGFL